MAVKNFTTMAAIVAIALLPLAAEAGLTKKQVRTLVRQEISKAVTEGRAGAQGPAGPPGATGPAGPPGMDGMPFLFARIGSDGGVDSPASGIAQENVRREDGFNLTRYCFSGLPPVFGGQVTLYAGGFSPVRTVDLTISSRDPGGDCGVLVQVSGIGPDGQRIPEDAAFYILLY